jgi:Tetratricopeptide repeat
MRSRGTRAWVGVAMLTSLCGAASLAAQPNELARVADEDYRAGRWREAASAYAQLSRDVPEDAHVWYRLGHARLELGRTDDAIEALEQAERRGFLVGRTRFLICRALARSGRSDRALDWLNRAVDGGFQDVDALRSEPDLAPLRGNALYEAALARAEQPVSFLEGGDSLDFWIGEWDVYVGDTLVGKDRIEKILGGAAILEHWVSSEGERGESVFYYLPDTGEWKQVWMVHGAHLVKEKLGAPVEGGLRFEGSARFLEGEERPDRTTLTLEEDGRVRQKIETSRDGGQTWTATFDAVYVRRE